MKSIFKTLAVLAIGLATVSCQKDELKSLDVAGAVPVTLKTENTKTYIVQEGNKFVPKWGKGDKITMKTKSGSTVSDKDFELENVSDDGALAVFTGEASGIAMTGKLATCYPAEALAKTYSSGNFGVEIPSTQYPSAGNIDPKADILVSFPVDYSVDNEEIQVDGLRFARIVALMRVEVKSTFESIKGEKIKSLSITSSGDNIAGRAEIDIWSGSAKPVGWNTKSYTVTAVASDDSGLAVVSAENNVVFLSLSANTLKSGTELSFDIETDKFIVSKEVTLANDLILEPGRVTPVTLTILEENCHSLDVDYSGEYIITGANGSKHYAAKKYVSGNSLPTLAIEIVDGKVPSVSGIDDCKMTVAKVEGMQGYYTIKDAGGKFLYAASNSGNQLKGENTPDINAYWKISCVDGEWTISADQSANRHIMRYNSGSNIFSCYASGQNPVSLVEWANVLVPLKKPVISSVSVDGKDVTVKWTDVENATTYDVSCGGKTQSVGKGVQSCTITVDDFGTYDVTVTAVAEGFAPACSDARQVIIKDPSKTEFSDVITNAETGLTGGSYSDWKINKGILDSPAGYAGRSAVQDGNIQLTNKATTESGIVSTVSGGYLNKVTVEWGSTTLSGRTLLVYGSNTAYVSPADLQNESKRGELLGQIICGTSTELAVYGPYTYVGIVPSDGAVYLSSVKIDWTKEFKEVPVDGVSIDPAEAVLFVGKTLKLNAIISPYNATNRKLSWTSSDEGTATVDAHGVVTGVKTGEAVITVTTEDGAKTASCEIEVTEPYILSYESLADLVDAGEPTVEGDSVYVTLSNDVMTRLYVSNSGKRQGVYLNAGDREIEIFCANVEFPATWVAGGALSGRVKALWQRYNSTWELCVDNWNYFTYEAPCATPVITLNGNVATITCATVGASIKYAISDNEKQPSNIGTAYSSPVTLSDGQTIWARAVKDGKPDSAVASAKYSADGGIKISIDFTSTTQRPSGFPTSSSNKGTTLTSYLIDGYSFSFEAGTAYYWGTYLMLGKSGAYIALPAIQGMRLTNVKWKTTSGCSTKVVCDIYTHDGKTSVYGNSAAASTSTTYDWDLSEKTSNYTSYQFRVTNSNNVQLASLELEYK